MKELGSVDSTTRTADETEAGIFWAYDREGLGTPLSLYNDVIEVIARQEGNSLEENAALFAQTSVAMADAAIVAWHTKFDEEFWRPVTAIHDGELDGNPLTEEDDSWTALGAPDGGDDIIGFTPQFPTYISGHATFGGALFGSLQEYYGTDDIAFDLSSNELSVLMENPELEAAYGLDLDDAVRSFDSLSEAMAENGRSRVYLGIHFDFDDTVGQDVGQDVAASVSSEFVVATSDNTRMRRPNRNQTEFPGVRRERDHHDQGPGDDLFRRRNRSQPSDAAGRQQDGRDHQPPAVRTRSMDDRPVGPQAQQDGRGPRRETPMMAVSEADDETLDLFDQEQEQSTVETSETRETTPPRQQERLLRTIDRLFSEGIPGLVSGRRR